MHIRSRISILLAALWWGSLTGLAFIVVPLLFRHLGSPAEAGGMAARLFAAQTWLSAGCAMLLLLVLNQKEVPAQQIWARAAIKFIVAGLLLALLIQFGVSPRIVNARAEGGNLRLWHALGSAMYLAQWLCAGLALWRLSAQRPAESA
jgi:hypothetical protein